jgi:ferredoxin
MNLKKKKLAVINPVECVGKWCAICAIICPEEAIMINETAWVEDEKCIGCGKCIKNICPNWAISLVEEL